METDCEKTKREKACRHELLVAVLSLLAFLLVTVLVTRVDLQAIGPSGSTVGCGTLNGFILELLGTEMLWYYFTDWLGLLVLLLPLAFTIQGLYQMLSRRSLFLVDPGLLALGVFYLLLIASYVFFEQVIINYRPLVLTDKLEASYPSSHVMIILGIGASTMMYLGPNMGSRPRLLALLEVIVVLVMVLTVIGRLLAGVHWFTDIAGGVLLASALSSLYGYCLAIMKYEPSPPPGPGQPGRNEEPSTGSSGANTRTRC